MNMKKHKGQKKLQLKSQSKLCKCFYMILYIIFNQQKLKDRQAYVKDVSRL